MNSQAPQRILWIDDISDTCELAKMFFWQAGLEVITAGTIAEALKLIRKEKFALFILDSRLKDGDSLELAQTIRASDKITPIVVYSGDAVEAHVTNALAAGANEYVVKPDWNKLLETVKSLLTKTSYSDLKSAQSFAALHINSYA